MDCIFARPIFRMPIFKLHCICGPEFGKHQGKKALICRALNGGKFTGLSTHQLQLQLHKAIT